ncbi:MAG TPA: hypothetical protein VGJ84_21235 [Polyangiaceae bacterium]
MGASGTFEIRTVPAYLGGEVGFYVGTSRADKFYTEPQWNTDSGSCPGRIHVLSWQSVAYSKAFYFGWEDLACGGHTQRRRYCR